MAQTDATNAVAVNSAPTIIKAFFSVRRPMLQPPSMFRLLQPDPAAFPARPHHRTSHFVKHRPSGLIAAQSQRSLQTQGTYAILLTGYMPHGQKPRPQRKMSVLKNRTGDHRGLVTTFNTPPQSPSHRLCLPSVATRTEPAVRPSQSKQIRTACLVGAETALQFRQSPGVIFSHNPEYYRLWLVESSK